MVPSFSSWFPVFFWLHCIKMGVNRQIPFTWFCHLNQNYFVTKKEKKKRKKEKKVKVKKKIFRWYSLSLSGSQWFFFFGSIALKWCQHPHRLFFHDLCHLNQKQIILLPKKGFIFHELVIFLFKNNLDTIVGIKVSLYIFPFYLKFVY